jgi:LacI family transcriptional regulator
MNKKHTIKDIAQLAGVSRGTVDRVLHKRGGVTQEVLDKVNEILNKIDYEPNLIARNLKSNKIHRICVILPDPDIDPYWHACVKGINDAIKEFKAFSLLIEIFYFNPDSKKSFLNINETVLKGYPDGVLLAPLFHKETLNVVNKYNSLGIIVSTFNNHVQLSSIKNFVGQDLFQSGRMAAKLLDLLFNNGQIAIIHIDESYENAIHMQEKEKGFRDYFSEKKGMDYKIITLKLQNPNFEINFINFLNENPNLSGVFVTTSKAYQIARIIGNRNNHNKIRIIGYDLIDENVTCLNQGLIDFLIHQNPKRQVYLGITCLVEHFLFEKEIPNKILLPIEIINSENANFYMV